MLKVIRTQEFVDWLHGLRDDTAAAKVSLRIDRLAYGNPGDTKPIGKGLSEIRIHYGPGYRVYFARRGKTLIIILAGGDKSSQKRDIALAHQLYEEYE